jgi:hypothetical protein
MAEALNAKTLKRLRLVAALALCSATLHSQTTREVTSAPAPLKTVSNPVRAAQFSLAASDHPVEFRSVDQMSSTDRELARRADASIRAAAASAAFDLNQGHWSSQQILCPALPQHLFLRSMRNGGSGDVSLFTVSIQRGAGERVHILAIQRRGFSLFTPAPLNARTIAVFNHIRDEERFAPSALPPNWLETGLCYAALSGADPKALQPTEFSAKTRSVPASPAVLESSNDGAAVVRFTEAATRPVEWTLDFDAKGRLLKVTRLPASLVREVVRNQ